MNNKQISRVSKLKWQKANGLQMFLQEDLLPLRSMNNLNSCAKIIKDSDIYVTSRTQLQNNKRLSNFIEHKIAMSMQWQPPVPLQIRGPPPLEGPFLIN